MNKLIVEACVETFETAMSALKNGASQIELCQDLNVDGLTPSISLLKKVLEHTNLPVKVMIRCRPGSFYFSQDELQQMKDTVLEYKKLNISGFVFGAIKIDSFDPNKTELDLEAIKLICEAASPKHVTIHKAIDLCSNIMEELFQLSQINGVDSILSSGGKKTAEEGIDNLNRMSEIASTYGIYIIAAGSITKNTMERLRLISPLMAFHGRYITH